MSLTKQQKYNLTVRTRVGRQDTYSVSCKEALTLRSHVQTFRTMEVPHILYPNTHQPLLILLKPQPLGTHQFNILSDKREAHINTSAVNQTVV